MDSLLWRLHLQRRLCRCAARAHRLLPHTRWLPGSSAQGNNVGAARRFRRHFAVDVSTLCGCAIVFPSFSTNEGFAVITCHVFACVFSVACVFVLFLCHGVHRQTNRHSREMSEIVPARTRARAHAEITRTSLSCGGDECDADSLSLLIHTYTH